jgi:cupin fold WbuC family metalloprotein
MIKRINNQLIDDLIDQARKLERKRKNFNLHTYAADPLQRLLNVLEPETYVCPHKHENPDKRELFTILKGKLLVVTFKNDGSIDEHEVLNRESGNYGIEVPPRMWHTIIAMETGTVVFEVKDGPYDPADDKQFAPWAPKEGENDAHLFNNRLLMQLNL